MIGIILAGGLGTRSGAYTHRITNKHLLYVYNRAMIDYPLLSLVEAGVKNVVIVTGGRHAGDLMNYLGNGKEFGFDSINYARQYGEGGIGDALRCAQPFVKDEPVCVILGDNLFEDSLSQFVQTYQSGGRILVKPVPDASSFGVATVQDGKVVKIVEKPKNPESNLAVVGAYIFDKDVFDIIKNMKPSARGELEVTDIIDSYLQRGILDYSTLNSYWTDMGSPDSLLEAANFIKKNQLAFAKRFAKYFELDLSLPVSRKQAEQILIELQGTGFPSGVVDFMQKHIKQLNKWGK